jgi:hypothetical protein
MFLDGDYKLAIFFLFILIFLLADKLYRNRINWKPALRAHSAWLAVFIIIFDVSLLYSTGGPVIYYHGKVQGKQDPWADVQIFARDHSHKDDLFIVPPYLPGFTTYSMRASLGDWAEGSTLLYLDNRFTREWFQRMYDIGWKDIDLMRDGYNSLTTDELTAAAKKYGAKFAVTEKPKVFDLPLLYENEKFILYKVVDSASSF